ncbi:hypothetical protein [Marinifilum fragile]|uniref:hypothetical protein n=1 Tax=Marinifilum fragile TaxID=570161 RepID=UPI002AA7BE33|nr:hypothetical protein [Marinifilum fragile]
MNNNKISSFFLNDTYRKLINNGRTYASYTKEELDIIFNDIELKGVETILDPMSGYGGLTNRCKKESIPTVCLELNQPSYYWQTLNIPSNAALYITLIEYILDNFKYLPRTNKFAVASDEYFTSEGIDLLRKLFNKVTEWAIELGINDHEKFVTALLTPFVFRFSTASNGDVTHVKKGGIAVFKGWQEDFKDYLNNLLTNCIVPNLKYNSNHKIILGDARFYKFEQKFDAVITSPPFPNYRDYYKMFAPENYFLNEILDLKSTNNIIGSNIVSGKSAGEITSSIANNFLNKLSAYKGSKKAEGDIRRYYLPYFKLYFSDLELVMKNIIEHLNQKCVCYFVVVNNATRNLIVPVAEVIEEFFESRDFSTEFILNSDVFHVGTKNPHAKGIKAKHTKYIVKAWRK